MFTRLMRSGNIGLLRANGVLVFLGPRSSIISHTAMESCVRIFLEFGNAPEYNDLALEYWDGTDVNGRFRWKSSVELIADAFGIPKADVQKLSSRAVKAVNLSVRCDRCNVPQELSSRSALTVRRYVAYVCPSCIEQQQRSRIASEERAKIHEIAAQQEVIDKLVDQSGAFDYEQVGYFEAVVVFGIMLASNDAAERGHFRQSDGLHLCESAGLSSKMLDRLFNAGILRFEKTTPPDAIKLGERDSWSYFPHRVHWVLAPDSGERSFPQLMAYLGDLIDMQEEHPDFGAAVEELWRMLAYDDALAYLSREVDAFRLPGVKVGPKTEQALWHALRNFSIPQVRREISSVVKNAAALSQHRDYARKHALNTIPGNLISWVDRAVSEDWQISCVLRNWQNDEPVLLTVLFNRVLGTGLPGFKSLSGQLLRSRYLCSSSVAGGV